MADHSKSGKNFIKFCNDNEVASGVGYLEFKDGTEGLVCHKIEDETIACWIYELMKDIAKRHEMTTKQLFEELVKNDELGPIDEGE